MRAPSISLQLGIADNLDSFGDSALLIQAASIAAVPEPSTYCTDGGRPLGGREHGSASARCTQLERKTQTPTGERQDGTT